MYQVRKKFRFEGAHVLSKSYSRECQRVHGHSYILEVMVMNKELNEDGMIIDFKKLGEVVKPLIEKWDHALIVEADRGSAFELESCSEDVISVPFNPTAENMAKHFYDYIMREFIELGDGHLLVRVHETESGWAEYWEERS